eukprot:10668451-Karenia_brevis.AAC.1
MLPLAEPAWAAAIALPSIIASNVLHFAVILFPLQQNVHGFSSCHRPAVPMLAGKHQVRCISLD